MSWRSTSPLEPAVLAAVTGALPGESTGTDPARTLRDLAAGLGAPATLAALGAERDALPAVAAQAAASPYSNPRDATESDIAALLDRAWSGDQPTLTK